MSDKKVKSLVKRATKTAEQNSKRLASQMQQCDKKIEELVQRKNILRQENEQNRYMALLVKEGALAWDHLNYTNKWKKESVLAVFANGNLPDEMLESNWDDFAPESSTEDRDILLARLNNPEFSYYHCRNIPSELFYLPDQFADDKELVCATVRQYPYLINHQIKEEAPSLLDDDDVFKAFIYSKPLNQADDGIPLGCDEIFESFPERIRGDEALMLLAASRYPETFHYLTTNLQDDANFALKLADKLIYMHNEFPYAALSAFSERVRSNPKVVTEFVKKNGLSLQYASDSLSCKEHLIRLACKEDPLAVLCCSTGTGQRALFRDKKFMMNIFDRIDAKYGRNGDFEHIYRMLPTNLKGDLDMVIAASKIGGLCSCDVPKALSYDTNFWIAALNRELTLWFQLPENVKREQACVRGIKDFNNGADVVRDIFKYHPELVSDVDLWTTIICSEQAIAEQEYDKRHNIASLLLNDATEEILNNRALMIQACKKDAYALRVLPEKYMLHREFVEAAVNFDMGAMLAFSGEMQILFPDLFITSIKNFSNFSIDTVSVFTKYVDPHSRENIDVLRAWFEANGMFPRGGRYPESLKTKPEFALLLAEYKIGIDDFISGVDTCLRCNKKFMEQAIALNGVLFFYPNLIYDNDLALIALGGTDRDTVGQLLFLNNKYEFMKCCWDDFSRRINAYKSFVEGFLPGMCHHTNKGSSLAMLVCGDDTAMAIKCKIANHVGIPTGKEMNLMRKAKSVLSQYIS